MVPLLAQYAGAVLASVRTIGLVAVAELITIGARKSEADHVPVTTLLPGVTVAVVFVTHEDLLPVMLFPTPSICLQMPSENGKEGPVLWHCPQRLFMSLERAAR